MEFTAGNDITAIDNLRRFCFTGVRGVGKSSIVEKLQTKTDTIQFVAGSDILKEMMNEGYDQFEYLSEEVKYSYRLQINETLCNLQQITGMDLLVDSHLTVYNLKNNRIDTIFTHKDCVFYTDIILLDSKPEEIYHHRKNDDRKKRIVDLNIIKKELNFERKEAIKISNKYSLNLHVVQMNEEATENILNILVSRKNINGIQIT